MMHSYYLSKRSFTVSVQEVFQGDLGVNTTQLLGIAFNGLFSQSLVTGGKVTLAGKNRCRSVRVVPIRSHNFLQPSKDDILIGKGFLPNLMVLLPIVLGQFFVDGVDGVVEFGSDAFLHLLEKGLDHKIVDFVQPFNTVYQQVAIFQTLILEQFPTTLYGMTVD